MVKLGELICHFHCRLTVSQAAKESGVCRETVGKLWKLNRERMSNYIESHPILFKPGDIVEVDELYLKPLLETNQENPDESVWHPIIGCIDRKVAESLSKFANLIQPETSNSQFSHICHLM